MKKIIVAIIGLIAFPYMAHASEVAVVNIQEVVKSSVAAQDVREQIKKTREKYQEQVTKQEDVLRSEEKKLVEQRALLSSEAFDGKRKEFENKVGEVQRSVQEKRAKLENAVTEAMAEVQKNVNIIVAELAKEKGFKIAIPATASIYAQDELDITGEVLERLNKRLSKVEVKIK